MNKRAQSADDMTPLESLPKSKKVKVDDVGVAVNSQHSNSSNEQDLRKLQRYASAREKEAKINMQVSGGNIKTHDDQEAMDIISLSKSEVIDVTKVCTP